MAKSVNPMQGAMQTSSTAVKSRHVNWLLVCTAGTAAVVWTAVALGGKVNGTILYNVISSLSRDKAERQAAPTNRYALKYSNASQEELKNAYSELASTLNKYWSIEGPLLIDHNIFTSRYVGINETVPVELSRSQPFTYLRTQSSGGEVVVQLARIPKDANKYQWLWKLWEESTWLWNEIEKRSAL